jgi:hypothetical protein
MLHSQVVDYLRYSFPAVLFRTDMGGVRLTMSQAIAARRLQAGRAWPDLFIAQPAKGHHGLFIELKATNIYKKDGTLLANPHIHEQAAVLKMLSAQGYKAVFAVGFTEAKQIIDAYLK